MNLKTFESCYSYHERNRKKLASKRLFAPWAKALGMQFKGEVKKYKIKNRLTFPILVLCNLSVIIESNILATIYHIVYIIVFFLMIMFRIMRITTIYI